MATTTQDPALQDPNAAVTDVSKSPGERITGIIGSLLGGGGPHLDAAIAAHHQKRLDQARRSRQEWATYHSIAMSGKNPDTAEPLTDEEKAKYNNWAEAAWADYEKAAGVNPQAKQAVQRNKGIIDRVSQFIQQRQGQQPAAAPGSLPAPPAAAPAADATATEGEHPSATAAASGGGLPPPPQATTATHTPQVAADAPRLQQKLDEERQFAFWKRQQDVLRENKIAENEALAAARVANRPVPRPVSALSVGVLDARNQRDAVGKIYLNTDGDPIDLDQMPDTMGLKGVLIRNSDTNQWETRYEPFSPNQATVTVGGETFAVSPMDKSKLAGGKAGTDIGAHNIETTRRTTDPATGQTTVSTSTPKVTGIKAGSLPAPPSAATPAAKPSATPTAAAAPTGGGTLRNTPAAASAAPPPLDDGGHIPAAAASSTPGMTPQVIEGANQLLDGKDVKDLPAKTKELSASLARKYGWEQGKFTPREQGALRNATQFIDDMLADPATLAVLDSATSRLKLNQVMAGTNKQQGMIGGALSTLAAGNMSDAEAKFQRQFNIIAQTIAGIAPAVRGSGSRTTEAAIQRLLTDMPNPKTVQGSKDATQRLQLLKKEIQRALVKGKFTDIGQAAEGKGSLPKPPSAGAPPPLSDAAKAYVRENHPNVVVP